MEGNTSLNTHKIRISRFGVHMNRIRSESGMERERRQTRKLVKQKK